MTEIEIKALVLAKIPDAQFELQINGNSFMLKIVSDAFDGLRALKRQQLVYSCVDKQIKSGEMHAVTMQLYTSAEWENQKKFAF